jgi:hypothetical protein
MHAPPRGRGARRAWRRVQQRGGAGRSQPSGRPRQRGRGGPRRRRCASAQVSHGEVARPSQGRHRLRPQRRGAAPLPRSTSCGRPTPVGRTVGRPQPVGRRRSRSAGPGTGRLPRPLRSRQTRWPRRSWSRWSTQGWSAHRLPGGRLRRAGRRGPRGRPVRPPPRPGRSGGWPRPERPVVGRPLARRQSHQRRPQPPRSAWRPTGAAREGVRGTPAAQASRQRGGVTARPGGVAVALRGEGSRRGAVPGVGGA